MIDIGWCLKTETQKYYPFEYRKPIKLSSYYGFTTDPPPLFYRCPAIIDYTNNMWEIRSVARVKVLAKDKGLQPLKGHEQPITRGEDNRTDMFDMDDCTFQYMFPDEIFVSDTPGVKVQTLPHPMAKYQNVVRAEFDIFKWLRPIHVAYFFDRGSGFSYDIEEGEPLYVVKFVTPNDEKINLVELDYAKIEKYCFNASKVNRVKGDGLKSKKWWDRLIESYSRTRPRKLIAHARVD